MFILLVSPPGVGKSEAIFHTNELWYATKDLHVAPDNLTKAALIDALASADRKHLVEGGIMEYHSLQVACSEFGVLVPAHDLEFLSVLNHIFDNPRGYREKRRTNNLSIDIIHPQINILAGSQPGFLASLLPEEAWSMGFTSRLIMVYAGIAPMVELFDELPPRDDLFQTLTSDLKSFTNLIGEFTWEESAKHDLQAWVRERMPPIPEHSKLANYIPRRIIHTLKLCMVAAVARSGELHITSEDLDRAKGWLLGAELVMPDVFRGMSLKSDAQLLMDLHWFMWKIWIVKKAPIHQSRLVEFLSDRTTSDKIFRVLEVAERSNMIIRQAGTELYTPRPRHEHGME